MRVIAGTFRSRPLHSLRGMDLRPTADRLRETLFNVLAAGNPAAFDGTVWVDLCAGTGAVGIEALSRGAARVCFVESSAPAARLIQRNLRSLGIGDGAEAPGVKESGVKDSRVKDLRVEVLRDDVTRALRQLEAGGVTADFIFLDPPYRLEKLYVETLQQLSQSRLRGPKTIVVAEHEKRFDPGDGVAPLRRYRTLTQGDAGLSFYRFSG